MHTSAPTQSLLRFSTAGSVDDGKSSLIGRLLHDSKNIYQDTLAAIKQKSDQHGSSLQLALVTDGLKAEVEQGITIDVAYRYFNTEKRRFILADSPGHEQYTRNMATGASTADLTILLVDATKGILPQTKRHAFIAALMGVPRLLVTVNKMDLINWSEETYEKIKQQFLEFSERLGIKDIRFMPVSAIAGDNVAIKSTNMPWYQNETLLEYLDNIYIQGDRNSVDFRFPVQLVLNTTNYRGYAGQIASGLIHQGDEVIVLPSMQKSTVKAIDYNGTEISVAQTPKSVTIRLNEQIDISRGNMLVRAGNLPKLQSNFESMLIWMDTENMQTDKTYLLRHTTQTVKARITKVKYRVDINALTRTDPANLELNEIGRVALSCNQALFIDSYERNRATGNFILVDPDTFQTAAAGMIIERNIDEIDVSQASPKSENLHEEKSLVTRKDRELKFGNTAMTYWFTGLSGSGKSTIAKALEQEFFYTGKLVYRLDGDNLRTGLNRDLGFSAKDRKENIRRVAEVAKLFNDAGINVICSFISPFKADRENAKNIIGKESFVEIYLSTPLETCQKRDPHNLYEKAIKGEIKEFTGISAPYEVPKKPDLELDTSKKDLKACVSEILVKR